VYLACFGLHRGVSVSSTGHHDRDRAPTGGIGPSRTARRRSPRTRAGIVMYRASLSFQWSVSLSDTRHHDPDRAPTGASGIGRPKYDYTIATGEIGQPVPCGILRGATTNIKSLRFRIASCSASSSRARLCARCKPRCTSERTWIGSRS